MPTHSSNGRDAWTGMDSAPAAIALCESRLHEAFPKLEFPVLTGP